MSFDEAQEKKSPIARHLGYDIWWLRDGDRLRDVFPSVWERRHLVTANQVHVLALFVCSEVPIGYHTLEIVLFGTPVLVIGRLV